MPLTATAINAAKPKAKAYKLTDGMGLYLLVTPTGGRLWRMNYRFAGKQKTLSFGNFPDLSLAKARELRAAAREALALGRDGIALSGTVHWMFDRGLISLKDDLEILVSRQANDADSIRALVNRSGFAVAPAREMDRPHPSFLAWHRDNCFKA